LAAGADASTLGPTMPESDRPPNSDRRIGDRAAIELKVEYKRLNTFFADYTKNISKGGTFIRTTKPLEIGTEFVFVLTVPEPKHDSDRRSLGAPSVASPQAGTGVHLELTGEVKWVISEAEATAETPAGMGIQFVFRNDTERQGVERFVADLMRSSLGDHIADRLLAKSHG
jgi:type IV pilus assembly protein PilZ